MTNKVKEEEMDGVPHHLMNFVDPLTPITVVDYRNRAIPLVSHFSLETSLRVSTTLYCRFSLPLADQLLT